MDAALATFAHFTISERTSAANCPGVLVTGSTPRSSRRLLVAGFLTIMTSASLSFATISFGVAAGEARFAGGRQLRKQRMALERAHRQRFEPARFHERNRGGHGLEHEVRL